MLVLSCPNAVLVLPDSSDGPWANTAVAVAGSTTPRTAILADICRAASCLLLAGRWRWKKADRYQGKCADESNKRSSRTHGNAPPKESGAPSPRNLMEAPDYTH